MIDISKNMLMSLRALRMHNGFPQKKISQIDSAVLPAIVNIYIYNYCWQNKENINSEMSPEGLQLRKKNFVKIFT